MGAKQMAWKTTAIATFHGGILECKYLNDIFVHLAAKAYGKDMHLNESGTLLTRNYVVHCQTMA